MTPEDVDPEIWRATDDVKNGEELDVRKVRDARSEEMDFIRSIGVYRNAKRSEVEQEGPMGRHR